MEQSQQRKKVIVIVLIVLTFLLGALAVGISYYIQQNQGPDSSSADTVFCTALNSNACSLANTITGAVSCVVPNSGVNQFCCPTGQIKQNNVCVCEGHNGSNSQKGGQYCNCPGQDGNTATDGGLSWRCSYSAGWQSCPANTNLVGTSCICKEGSGSGPLGSASVSCTAYPACNVSNLDNCVDIGATLTGSSPCTFASNQNLYKCCPTGTTKQGNTCMSTTARCTVACQTTACGAGQTASLGLCEGSGFCCLGTANSGGSGTGGDSVKGELNSCTSTCNDIDGCNCPTGCQNTLVGNGSQCGDQAQSGGVTAGSCGSGGTCFQQGGTYSGTIVNNCGSVGRQDSSPNSCGAGYLCCALQNSGSSQTQTVTKAQCGSSCKTTDDCATPTSAATVTCRNGICENSLCAAGKTVPGSNCACSTLNACGQPCNGTLGLCQSGSECGFIGATNSCADSNGSQFCLPTSPQKSYTLANCTGIAALNLRSPLGTNVTTQAQVLEACNLITPTAAPTTNTGTGGGTTSGTSSASVCGDAICAANENSFTCPGDCKLPDTGIFSDRIDRLMLGIIVIILGVSLAGGFDRLRKSSN